MYLWYGLLWVVIEGFQDRKIDLRGRLQLDIDYLGPTMKRCRNANLPRAKEELRRSPVGPDGDSRLGSDDRSDQHRIWTTLHRR